MNILILISSLSIGGAEKQAVKDANMLCTEHNVYVVVFKDGQLSEKLDNRANFIVINKSGYLRTAKLISRIVLEYKIQIIHASLFASMIIAALASIRSNVLVIWNFHSHEYDIPLKSKLSFMVFSRLKRLQKILYVNRELRFFFENRLKLPSNKADILYNTTEFKIDDLKEATIEKESIIIGYVGQLIKLKRVEYLIELAKYLLINQITSFKIQIIGDGENKEYLEKLAKETGVEGHIVFHGYKIELKSLYQTFDILINPSREECLSVALIDAGIMGIPSIAFDVGGNSDIVINNETGYIVSSKEELFEKVKYLIHDFNKRKDFGNKAIHHCSMNFTEETRKEKLNQIFRSVLYG